MKLKDPKGKLHKLHYKHNTDGFGARAWVRVGLFRKIDELATGSHVIDNLVRRLEKMGWKVVDE